MPASFAPARRRWPKRRFRRLARWRGPATPLPPPWWAGLAAWGRRRLLRGLLALLLVGGLAGAAWVLLEPLPRTLVSLDLHVSTLTWVQADTLTPNPDWLGLVLAGNDSSCFLQPAAHVGSQHTGQRVGGPPLADDDLLLCPLRPYAPVQLSQLRLPDRAQVQLARLDSQLVLRVEAPPGTRLATPLQWTLSYGRRQGTSGGGQPRIMAQQQTGEAALNVLVMEQPLTDVPYQLEFRQPHRWPGPVRLMARSLDFSETDPNGTASISGVLGGKVRLLDTNDPALELTERDVVRVQFTHPVEVLLYQAPHGLRVRVAGLATRLDCGPGSLEGVAGLDQRPLRIRKLTDRASYAWALLVTLVPALLAALFTKYIQRP